jgi:hypothetical protein
LNVLPSTDGSKGVAKFVGAVAETAHNRVGGSGEFGGSPSKAYPALVKQRDTVAGDQRLDHVMGHDERRKSELPLVFGDHGKNGVAAQRIEAGGRLVEKHEFRTGNDRSGKRETLLHAAGKLAGVTISMIINFKLSQSFKAALTDLIVCEVCRLFKRERHILQSRQRIEEGIALEEETATPAKLRSGGGISETQGTSVKADPACIRLHDVCQALKEHGLAGSARAEKAKNAASQHLESDSRQNNMVAEALVQVLDVKQEILLDGDHDQTRNEVIT